MRAPKPHAEAPTLAAHPNRVYAGRTIDHAQLSLGEARALLEAGGASVPRLVARPGADALLLAAGRR